MVASIVLCAGLGTRLAPLTAWRAKPLVPVGDRPALAHVVDRVRAVSRVVVVNAFHRAADVEAYARGAGLVVSREAELLGTAGGIAQAAPLLGAGDVLVWNGDMLGDLDAAALVARHAASGAVATMAVRARADLGGNVGIDPAGRVVRIRRETCAPGEARSADFLGVHVMGDELRRGLPRVGGLIEDAYLPAMHRGARVVAFDCDASFVDVGTPAEYLRANLAWLAKRGERKWLGVGAEIERGVEVEDGVIGDRAKVVGEGKVARCVVWPGAEVKAPIANAIVAMEGVVRVAP